MSMIGSGGHSASPSSIKLFLRADSPEELVQKQLDVNLAIKGEISLTDITFADGEWVGWFLIDIDKYRSILGDLNGIA